jgi:hypothetical protein
MQNCIQCEILLPEIQERVYFLSRKVELMKKELETAKHLLQCAEPSGATYVDIEQRSAWRKSQKELLENNL